MGEGWEGSRTGVHVALFLCCVRYVVLKPLRFIYLFIYSLVLFVCVYL